MRHPHLAQLNPAHQREQRIRRLRPIRQHACQQRYRWRWPSPSRHRQCRHPEHPVCRWAVRRAQHLHRFPARGICPLQSRIRRAHRHMSRGTWLLLSGNGATLRQRMRLATWRAAFSRSHNPPNLPGRAARQPARHESAPLWWPDPRARCQSDRARYADPPDSRYRLGQAAGTAAHGSAPTAKSECQQSYVSPECSFAPAGGGCRRSRLGVVSDGILARPPSGATRHLPPAGGNQCCCTRLTSESRARATVSGCSTALK